MGDSVFARAHEVTSRLVTAVGATEQQLREGAAKGLDARLRCTPFHPPSAPGYYQWSEGIVGLRQVLAKAGWTSDDTGGFSTVVRPDERVRIAIAMGDSRTGKEGLPDPTTKYPRGAMTLAAVRVNQQLALDVFGNGRIILPPDQETPTYTTWWLLIATRANEMRMEISCPRDIGEDNRIDSWSERIILKPLDLTNPLPLTPEEQEIAAIDVPVERR